MARIIDSNHFADGWQNKKASEKVAENIRHTGQEQAAINRTAANRVMEGIVHSKNIDASHTSAAKVQENNRVHAPAQRQIAHSETTQASRPEVQTEGARVLAQEQFQRLRSEAKNLEGLVGNRVSQTRATPTATADAVANASHPTQASLQQNAGNAATFTLSQAMRGIPGQQQRAQAEAASRNVDPRKLAPEDPSRARQLAERPDVQRLTQQGARATPEGPQVVTQAAQASITPNRDGPRSEAGREDEGRVSTGRRGPGRAAVYRSGAGSTPDDMDRIMGGESFFSGDTSSETADGESSAAAAIPQEDTLQVYNEFDSERPGLETILARRNILERHVIKSVVERRLVEIRNVDEEAGAKIQDAFAVRPLRERIMGDIEVDLGNFYKGLYNGGLIG